MKLIFFSIIAFSMIGLMFPSGFSEIYVHESGYPFSISHPSGWEALDEDEWYGVSIDPDKTGRNGFYITLYCSESSITCLIAKVSAEDKSVPCVLIKSEVIVCKNNRAAE